MCGIFGVALTANANISYKILKSIINKLYCLSESRGKESAGLYLYQPIAGKSFLLKGACSASKLIKTREYNKLFNQEIKPLFATDINKISPLAILAHSRLVTNGSAESSTNNQPISYGAVNIIHNGIIVNEKSLWAKYGHLQKHTEVDTEIVAAMLDDLTNKYENPFKATTEVFAAIKGAASVVWSHEQFNWVTFATNTGDLYYTIINDGCFIFASEKYIIEQIIAKLKFFDSTIHKVLANTGMVLNLNNFKQFNFSLINARNEVFYDSEISAKMTRSNNRYNKIIGYNKNSKKSYVPLNYDGDEKLLRYNESNIAKLKRCTRCILPETFPFIKFDQQGVCNYCHNYKPYYQDVNCEQMKANFVQSLENYRRNTKEADVLVPFSGGRDSSYGLHLIKNEFGFTPITFTYDWGMVTDLARRNIARMCGQLGVENILVSANIKKKRENIGKNVAAWLHKPDLGLIPLFMAGDKQFFKIVNDIKNKTKIKLNLWCANPLENTDFKSGFCNISPDFEKIRLDYLSISRKIHLACYYGLGFIKNFRYLNVSLLDTMNAFFSYYLAPRKDFYFLFNHVYWNETEVNNLLIKQYDWELAEDTESTWRIGDGTAPFYNYIYVTARGFSEFDTFRSNQIREGMITREQALKQVVIENRPRFQSLKWYLDTINLEFNSTIKAINDLDILGLHR